MMEFFEVPSSANGAIGTADGGYNFDWARSDIKPGLLNLNLIIDEEVFAGLFDDPRLNERLAAYAPNGTAIPLIVTQIDGNGYPTLEFQRESPGWLCDLRPAFGQSAEFAAGSHVLCQCQ